MNIQQEGKSSSNCSSSMEQTTVWPLKMMLTILIQKDADAVVSKYKSKLQNTSLFLEAV